MSQELVNAVIPIVVAILFAFVAGGTTVAAALLILLRMLLKSPVILSFLEKLFQALSPEWQAVLKDVAAVGDEVTDGVPADSKLLAS